MTTLAHDALYLTAQRLLRLAREGKLFCSEEDAPEVRQLLADAQGALELDGLPHFPPPVPQILPKP